MHITRKKEMGIQNGAAAASIAGGSLKPKLYQYLVMAAADPISPGSDASENYVYW